MILYEHWTETIAKEYAKQGYKYSIFDRRSKGDGYHQGINSLMEMYAFLDKAYAQLNSWTSNKTRIALKPDSDDKFYIIYYDENGKYWVKGKILLNIKRGEAC